MICNGVIKTKGLKQLPSGWLLKFVVDTGSEVLEVEAWDNWAKKIHSEYSIDDEISLRLKILENGYRVNGINKKSKRCDTERYQKNLESVERAKKRLEETNRDARLEHAMDVLGPKFVQDQLKEAFCGLDSKRPERWNISRKKFLEVRDRLYELAVENEKYLS